MTPLLRNTRDALGDALTELGNSNKNIVVIDADVGDSTRTFKFAEAHGNRFFNVGISEQDLIGTATGLSLGGFTVFVAMYAAFVSRCVDQLRYTVAYHKADVKVVATHAGLGVGEDGPSAHAISDVAFMRAIPNFRVFATCDYPSTTRVIRYVARSRGPVYVRLLRQDVPDVYDDQSHFVPDRAATLRDGSDVTLISHGAMVLESLGASKLLKRRGISAGVMDMHCIKPLDADAILRAASNTGRLVTVEDHNVIGGLGSAVSELVATVGGPTLLEIGVRDVFAESAGFKELYRRYGLSSSAIASQVARFVGSVSPKR